MPDNQAPLYFKSTDEMLKEFSYLGEDRAYEGGREEHQHDRRHVRDSSGALRKTTRRTSTAVSGGRPAQHVLRKRPSVSTAIRCPSRCRRGLTVSLGSIIGNGYAVMYIIAQKLVTKSLADGYLVGSRGSVGSSLAAFMSDITEVNSLAPHYLCPDDKYLEWHEEYSCGVDLPDKICPKCGKPLTKQGFNIPFETFLGFEGDKVPDIDLNFAGEYQSRIHWYTGEIFGHDHVFRAGTIGTVAEKTAFGYVKSTWRSAASSAPVRRKTAWRRAAPVCAVPRVSTRAALSLCPRRLRFTTSVRFSIRQTTRIPTSSPPISSITPLTRTS